MNVFKRLLYPVIALPLLLLLHACAGSDGYNPGDPSTREFLLTNLLHCMLRDSQCPGLICPSGYVNVAANPSMGTTSEFCVSQFEMKLEASGVIDVTGNFANAPWDASWLPRSAAQGKPWVWLNQTQAKSSCSFLGTRYHLITNPEWMTVARDIENVAANWSAGIVGAGTLSRGWTNIGNTAAAPNGDSTCLYNTGVDTCGSSGSHVYKRSQTLSIGYEIWDFSGNVWSWIDRTVTPANKAYHSSDGQPVALWREWTQIDTNISANDEMPPSSWQPLNTTLTGTNGIGRYFAGANSSGGGMLRGADWGDEADAGIYSLSLATAASGVDPTFGFRCVYQ